MGKEYQMEFGGLGSCSGSAAPQLGVVMNFLNASFIFLLRRDHPSPIPCLHPVILQLRSSGVTNLLLFIFQCISFFF